MPLNGPACFTLKISSGGEEFALHAASSASRAIERALWSCWSEQWAEYREVRSEQSRCEVVEAATRTPARSMPISNLDHLELLAHLGHPFIPSPASYLSFCQPLRACASTPKYFPPILRQYLAYNSIRLPHAIQRCITISRQNSIMPHEAILYYT